MKVDSAAWLNDVANVDPSSQTLPLEAQDQHEDSRQVDVANGYQGLGARLAMQQVEQSLRSYAAASAALRERHATAERRRLKTSAGPATQQQQAGSAPAEQPHLPHDILSEESLRHLRSIIMLDVVPEAGFNLDTLLAIDLQLLEMPPSN